MLSRINQRMRWRWWSDKDSPVKERGLRRSKGSSPRKRACERPPLRRRCGKLTQLIVECIWLLRARGIRALLLVLLNRTQRAKNGVTAKTDNEAGGNGVGRGGWKGRVGTHLQGLTAERTRIGSSVGEVPEEAHEAECMRACVFVAATPAEGDYHRAEDHTQCGYQMRGQQDP